MIAAMDPEDHAIHRFDFDNGLRLVCEPMPWLETVSVTLLLPFGAATDPAGQEGSAALLFDWMQRGAGELDSRALSDRFDSLGVRRGGGAGREATTLSASMLSAALPDTLALLADMVRRPLLADDEFEPARALVQQERASLDDQPTHKLFEALIGRFFASRHGRSSYGTEAGLAALAPDGVRRDAAARVGPAQAVLTVAGGVDPERTRSYVEEAFGDWTGGNPGLEAVELRPAHRHHIDAASSQVQIGLAFESLPPTSNDWYLQALALSVLSGGSGSRLYTEVRERRGLVYSVSAGARGLRGFGYTIGYAGTTPDRAGETLEVMMAEIVRLRSGVEADELERARTGLLSSLVMQGESSGARSGAMANDIHLRGVARSLSEVRAAVAGPSVDAVNRYLAASPEPSPTVLTLGPAPVAVLP